jgi:hypothetical protein
MTDHGDEYLADAMPGKYPNSICERRTRPTALLPKLSAASLPGDLAGLQDEDTLAKRDARVLLLKAILLLLQARELTAASARAPP